MLLDSWAWIEFFKGTSKGEKVKKLIDGKQLYTSCLNIAEVAHWCKKNNKNIEQHLSAIRARATVLLLEEKTCEAAGAALIKLRETSPGMGMVDAIIYAQAVAADLLLVSGDPHFKLLQGVEFID